MRPYIGIEGPIGVGKTTLAGYLETQLKAERMLEVFEENPFLAKFYDNPDCYALQTQLFFLMSRYRQHENLSDEGRILVSDYIFAKNDLFAGYTLNGEEFDLYMAISRSLAAHLLNPTLVVYLHADLDTLMGRIRRRGRQYEQKESMYDYMANLVDQYEAFFATYNAAPVLRLDTSQINIVDDIEARRDLTRQITDAFNRILAELPTQAPLL